MKKKIIYGILIVIVLIVLIYCKEVITNIKSVDTDLKNVNENSSLNIDKYKVEKTDKYVAIINKKNGYVITTKYIYVDKLLSRVNVEEKYESITVAEETYESTKIDAEKMKDYKDIILNGSTIILVKKDELFESLKKMNIDSLYDYEYKLYKDKM